MRNDIILRELTVSDVSDEQGYVKWLNDPEINRYLECRHSTHTLESARRFVDEMHKCKDNYLFGIFLDGVHTGNIKIGGIHHAYKRADIGLLISKEYWGRGIATTAIGLAENIAFTQLGLHKLFAGVYSPNTASLRAFLKNDWTRVGEYKDHCVDIDGEYIGCYLVEKLNPNIEVC